MAWVSVNKGKVMNRAIAMRILSAVAAVGLVNLASHTALAEPVTTRQLVEVVDFGGVSVSPDGRLVAFRTEQASVERNTYQTVWYVQPVDGTSPPRRLGEGGEPLRDTGGLSAPEAAVWSADGRWIFYRVVLDGRIDVWRAAVDGSRSEPVTHDPANVRALSLSTDGSTLNYSVGATREAVVAAELAEYNGGVHIDRTVPLGDNLFRSGFHEGRLATQRLIDNELERFPLLTSMPDRWRALDLSTGVTTEITADHRPARSLTPSDLPVEDGDVSQLAEDPGTGRIAVLIRFGERNGQTERPNVALAVLARRNGSHPVKCSAELCVGKRITDILWRPDSDEIIFTVTDRDTGLGHSIFRWNVVTGIVLPVVRSPGQLGGGGRFWPGSCARSHEALVCVAAEADRPPKLERIDLESGASLVLFDPNARLAQDMSESAPVRFLSWTDAQGERFTGQFYPAVASHTGPPPLFIAYYRCSGFLRGGMGDEWPLATLADRGIAALCINSPPSVEDAVKRYQWGLSAINHAVALLGTEGEIDPKRVGLGGLSFGTEVSLWTAMNSDLPRAISISTPVASPMARFMLSLWGEEAFSRFGRFWQLGAPEETPERWRLLSPAYDTERIKAPVLMQMSEQEWRLSFDYTVPMIRTQQADAYVFPNETHQKFQPRHKLAVYDRNLDWFRFWLQDYEDPDPLKAEQYRHWEAMRTPRNAVAAAAQEVS
jgi:dipeptidyl aminopeptidase/acylaminoacyl peptidase